MVWSFDTYRAFFAKHAFDYETTIVSAFKSQNNKKEFAVSIQKRRQKLLDLRPDFNLDEKFAEAQKEIARINPTSGLPEDAKIMADVIVAISFLDLMEQEYNKLARNEYIIEETVCRNNSFCSIKRIYDITTLGQKDTDYIVTGKGDKHEVILDSDRYVDLSHAIILGDFDCSKQKSEFKFPKEIHGRLICHGLKTVRQNANKEKTNPFADNFIIPKGVTEFDCSHSGIGLNQLCDLQFPESLKKIIVENSFINQIAKKTEFLEITQKFIARHPNIDVIGDKGTGPTLSEIVVQILAPQETVAAPLIQKPQTTSTSIKTKANSDLNSTDILTYIDKALFFEQFEMDEESLKKQIRILIKEFGAYERKQNNTTTKCIDKSQISDFITRLKYVLENQKDSAKEEPKEQKQDTKPDIKRTLSQKQQKKEHHIIIKKYIPKNIWNDTKKACGKDIMKQKSTLQIICSVNLDPRETSDKKRLQIFDLKTNTRTNCSFLEKKGAQCITQCIDVSRVDRKRLVWTYLPENQILVCTGYFADHAGSDKRDYVMTECNAKSGKDAVGKKIEYLEIIQSDKYYDAEKLLEEFEINEIFTILQKTQISDSVAAQIVQHYTGSLITILDREIKSKSKVLITTNSTEAQQAQTTYIQKLISIKKQLEQDVKKVNYTTLAGILKKLKQY